MRNNEEITTITEDRMKEKDLSLSELARRVGMAKSALSRYFNRTREFPLNKVHDFAKVLDLNTEYVLGFSEKSEITTIYNQLEAPRQTKVYEFAEYQLEEQNQMQSFKVYGQTAAGTPIEYGQDAVEERETSYVPKGAEVALVINGKSMEPNHPNGSIVFYKRQPQVENGSVAIVEVDGGVTCKKVKFDYDNEKIILQSINPEFEDVIVESEQVKILGLVVK